MLRMTVLAVCALLLLAGAAPLASSPATPTAANKTQTLEQQASEEEVQRQKDDLAAQMGMDASAREMVTLTKLQVVLAALTTIGLGVTIALTLASLRQTRQSLDMTRSAITNELRAYIGRESFDGFGTDEQGRHVLHFTLKNYGPTEARNVRLCYVIWTIDGFPRSAPIPELFNPNEMTPGGNIAPHSDFPIFVGYAEALPVETLTAFQNKTKSVGVLLKIVYDDCFGNEHTLVMSDIRSGPGLQDVLTNEVLFRPAV